MAKLIRLKKEVNTSEIKQEEDLGTSLKDQEVICDFIDCEDKECSHNGKHNKLKMMHACRIPCGVHSEAKCI